MSPNKSITKGFKRNLVERLILLMCALSVVPALRAQTPGRPAAPSDLQIGPITLVPAQVPIPPSYFDLNILFNTDSTAPWPPVPFYAWRLSHVNWPQLEPQRNQWHFDLLDKYVQWAQEHKTELLMTLTFTPQWASSSPNAPSDWPQSPGFAGVPTDMNDWRTFVRTVGNRYKGRIHVYEIWNEPDRPKDWVGGVDAMIEMVREASKILKEIDPGITVVSPCPTYPNGAAWLTEFLQKGGGQYVDVIAYHFYVGQGGPPEGAIPLIQKVEAAMVQYGAGNKALWNTEAGWHDPRPFPSDQLAAAYVARSYILNWASGISRFYWYCWDNHDWTSLQMISKDNARVLPQGMAYATIGQWLVGSTMAKCTNSPERNWVCQLNNNGAWRYIVWNTDGDRSFRISKDWHVKQATTLDGNVSKISGDVVSVGIQPVLLQ